MKYLLIIITALLFPLTASATAFYLDPEDGSDGNDGLSTTTPWQSYDKFVENVRVEGDILYVKRGTASTTNVTGLTTVSSGIPQAWLSMSADFDNLWNDFATSSQTYTTAAASTTLVANTTITGISAGDWVYVEGDCQETYNSKVLNLCEYAYEVQQVGTTHLLLWRPYMGQQVGSGKDLRVMPPSPIWGNTNGGTGLRFECVDDWWYLKGLQFQSSDANGVIRMSAGCQVMELMDMNLVSDRTSANILSCAGNVCRVWVKKLRGEGATTGSGIGSGGGQVNFTLEDTYLYGALNLSSGRNNIVGIERGYLTGQLTFPTNSGANSNIIAREVSIGQSSANPIQGPTTATSSSDSYLKVEDWLFNIGDNRTWTANGFGNTFRQYTSSTTVTYSGGGNSSVLVEPNLTTSATSSLYWMKIAEFSFYADTTSKTYTAYFKSTSTADWIANPTASELFIDCNYWANTLATSTRYAKRSTGTVDFAGSTDWQSLSVTCQPTQAGLMYVRAFYRKEKEVGKQNAFFMANYIEKQ